MKNLTQIQDINSDLQTTSQVSLNTDRDKASALGITTQQIENTLRNAYGGYQVSTIYAASNEYQVILELEPQYQQDPNAFMQLYVSGGSSSSSTPANNSTSTNGTADNTSNTTATATTTSSSSTQEIPRKI